MDYLIFGLLFGIGELAADRLNILSGTTNFDSLLQTWVSFFLGSGSLPEPFSACIGILYNLNGRIVSEDVPCGELGGDRGASYLGSVVNRSERSGKNSGAVVAKNMSFLEATSWSLGIDMVWTKLPLTIRRISIESEVKAITYGKAHTERKIVRYYNNIQEWM